MYCYNCRSIINNGLTKCPQCGADMEIVSDMILDNILSELEKYCPEVNNNAEIFTIGNDKVKLEGAIVCGIILAAIAIIVVPVLLSNLDIWLSILFLDLEIDAVFVRNVLLVIAVLWEIGGIGSIPSERKCKKLKPTYEEMSKLGSAGYKIRMSKK